PTHRQRPGEAGRAHPGCVQGHPAGVPLMPKLTFQLRGGCEGRESAVPIEIRKPSMALVCRITSADTVYLEAGQYLVTATLGGGQVTTREVTLDSRRAPPVLFDLPADPCDEARPETHL